VPNRECAHHNITVLGHLLRHQVGR
jgi:hypothetical protein